jgi:type IV fimbrial biogenesis protein FimT
MKPRAAGFSLIELMIVVTLVMIMVAASMPAVSDMLQNSRTRSVADSLQNGIRYAQTESARMGRLTTLVTTSTSWTVNYTKISGGNDTLPTLLQSSPAGNVGSVVITPDSNTHTVLQFNDLGRVKAASTSAGAFTALTADMYFTVSNSKGPRSLRVYVSPSGKVRMCDPDKSLSAGYPDGC